MSLRVLLLNSDLASNRGDRAIAEGLIQLVRSRDPEARITGISQKPDRDRAWYGIDFLDMDFQSLHPRDMLRTVRAARHHDLILWGGGELLKDYTNKAALWYWVLKMVIVTAVNPQVIGAFQGIGPTKSRLSKRLIALVVRRTRLFIVRDEESRAKLLDWGVPPDKVVAASDPAVLPEPEPMDESLRAKLCADYGLAPSFFDNVVCVGPRDWFHYQQSGILPFKYRRRLAAWFGRPAPAPDPRHQQYMSSLTSMVTDIASTMKVNILLLPMHMDESDTALAHSLAAEARTHTEVCVLDRDDLTPQQVRSVVASSRAMVGFRLHSNIIGISSAVPSVNVYYVDKGRVFFDQIGMSDFAMPIEATLEPDFSGRVRTLLADLIHRDDAVRTDLQRATRGLRTSVENAYESARHVS